MDKENETSTSKEDGNKRNNASNTIEENKEELKETTKRIDARKSTNDIPKAGANDNATVILIVFFSAISIISFVKYKNMK